MVKTGYPIPVRFPDAVEKRLRIYAIENDCTLSDAIRSMVSRGLASLEPASPAPAPRRRRVLSRGVPG